MIRRFVFGLMVVLVASCAHMGNGVKEEATSLNFIDPIVRLERIGPPANPRAQYVSENLRVSVEFVPPRHAGGVAQNEFLECQLFAGVAVREHLLAGWDADPIAVRLGGEPQTFELPRERDRLTLWALRSDLPLLVPLKQVAVVLCSELAALDQPPAMAVLREPSKEYTCTYFGHDPDGDYLQCR